MAPTPAKVFPDHQAIGEEVLVEWFVPILDPKHKAEDYTASINWDEGSRDDNPKLSVQGCYLNIRGTRRYLLAGKKNGKIYVTCKKKGGWSAQTTFSIEIGVIGPKTENSDLFKFFKDITKTQSRLGETGQNALEAARERVDALIKGRR